MGALISMISQTLPPKPKWTPKDIPDLTNKVVIVTGGNTGIGKETVKALLEHNAKVYLAARSKDRAEGAIQDLKTATGKEAIWLPLDLSDLGSVKQGAEDFLSKENDLHILFNSAGVMTPPIEQTTKQGYDLQFGTNVLGHFYFTKLLLPALENGAKSSPDHKSRVVHTSSSASELGSLDWDTFKDGQRRKKSGKGVLYAQSKFGNVVVSRELARRYADKGVVSTSVNPGNLQSELQRHLSTFEKLLIKPILYPTHYGAITQLFAGTSPEAAELNGKYLVPWARQAAPNKKSDDPATGEKLWQWLDEQVASY